MKEDFKEEKELTKLLNLYRVDIPKQLTEKLNIYQRFIRYLASPTKDPLEEITDSSKGYLFLKTFPLTGAFLLALLQGLFLH